MSRSKFTDPFTVFGVSRDAGEAEVRARYLELVKQFPPDREPEKFHEIRAAFEVLKDPLSIARRLIEPPDEEVPEWSDAIESQKQNPPRLSTAFLLSLGNRAEAPNSAGGNLDGGKNLNGGADAANDGIHTT